MDKKKIMKEIRSWIIIILGALCVAVLFNSVVFAKVKIQHSSMEKTLYENQQVIVNKLNYNFGEPKRGDVVIFLENEEKGSFFQVIFRSVNSFTSIFNGGHDKYERLVKRVIGVYGDEVDIKDGFVYINGERLEESYTYGETMIGKFKLPLIVGENELFVLGDHRTVSIDSRAFGPINSEQVEGKAVYRIYPFNQMGTIK